MRRRPIVCLALLAVLGGCAIEMGEARPAPAAAPARSTEVRMDPVLQRVLDANLAERVGARAIPGMAVAVVRGDVVVAKGQAGVRSLATGAPLAPGDRFHIGSLAKPMTATMIATLVEEGRLRWDATAGETFPEWRDAMDPALRDATLEDFLSHRAGLQPFTGGAEYRAVPRVSGSPQEQRTAFVRWLLARPPKSPPGGFVYSNADYAVAAAFAERAAGKGWEALMRERVFAPLGLASAGFGWPRAAGPEEPSGHWNRRGGYVPHGPSDPYVLSAAGGPGGDIHMSIEDLARFAAAHLAALRGDGGLVRAETARRLQRPRGEEGYGLGWALDAESFGEPRVYHDGATGIFRARIWIFPERDLAFVAAANADSEEVAEAASMIFQRLRRAQIGEEGAAR